MSSGIYRSSHQSGYLRRPLVEAFDVVWPGEIMARAHHGGSACGNAETEGFAHLPADRDRKEHGGKEAVTGTNRALRSEEHKSELQSLMHISYAAFFLKKKKIKKS